MKETRGSIRKILYGCKRPIEISRISVWVKETCGDIQNFCVGVRDLWRYPEFLCGCKGCLREKTRGHGYHVDLELGDRSRD